VIQILSDGGVVGEFWGKRAVFRGVSDVAPGEDIAVRFAFEPGAQEIRVKDAHLPLRGRTVFHSIILGVSVVTLLVVLANVRRRFLWSWRSGVARREGEAGWRTS
jgi:hypothetical protein